MSILLSICYLQLQQVYCISVALNSWWVISFIIHNHNILEIRTHNNNVSFSIFQIDFLTPYFSSQFSEAVIFSSMKIQNIKDNTMASTLLFICYLNFQ